MTEAQFQSKFTAWLRTNAKESAAYELKVVPGKSFALKRIAPHQISALLRASSGTLPFKIPDVGLGWKPFDCFVLKGVPSYVVVLFRAKKGNLREFFLIPAAKIKEYMDQGTVSLKEKDVETLFIKQLL